MARSKPTARDALKKLREQRAQLENEEARLREEAATELGKLLIECSAETIDPAQWRGLSENAYRVALAIGDWTGIAASLRELYRGLPITDHVPERAGHTDQYGKKELLPHS